MQHEINDEIDLEGCHDESEYSAERSPRKSYALGFVPFDRALRESVMFQNPLTWKVYSWCMFKARWKRTARPVAVGGLEILLRHNQFIFGRHTAASELEMPPTTVYKQMQKLQKIKAIRIEKKNSKGKNICSVIEVLGEPNSRLMEYLEEQQEEPLNVSSMTVVEQGGGTNEEIERRKDRKKTNADMLGSSLLKEGIAQEQAVEAEEGEHSPLMPIFMHLLCTKRMFDNYGQLKEHVKMNLTTGKKLRFYTPVQIATATVAALAESKQLGYTVHLATLLKKTSFANSTSTDEAIARFIELSARVYENHKQLWHTKDSPLIKKSENLSMNDLWKAALQQA